MSDMSNLRSDKVLLIQNGARHRYFLPRMIEGRGRLAAFYTDAHSRSAIGRIAAMLPQRLKKGGLQRLIDRKILGVPMEKVRAFDLLIVIEKIIAPLKKWDYAKWYLVRDVLRFRLHRYWGTAHSGVIYSMSAENLRFLQYARSKGVKIVVDVFISPLNLRIMSKEKAELGLPCTLDERNHEIMEGIYSKIYDVSDVILCPSRWVAEGVAKVSPGNSAKTRICAYGSSIPKGQVATGRVKGRIFWAGGEWLRKGLHYLVGAVESLKERYPELEVRVAGLSGVELEEKGGDGRVPDFGGVVFLGKLNTRQMSEEFLHCEMFVLPTLAEGMASVVLEAIALGCPVIVTQEAGIDGLRDGYNGLLVQSGSTVELAAAIERLHLDAELRDMLVRHAAEIADSYSMEAWTARIDGVLGEVSGRSNSIKGSPTGGNA